MVQPADHGTLFSVLQDFELMSKRDVLEEE
jgi:hypothetical protein